MKNSIRRMTLPQLTAVTVATLVVAAFSLPLEAADRSATSSRSGSVSRSDISTATSSGSTATSSRSGASSTRSSGNRSGGTATRSSSGAPSRYHPSDRYRYNHRSYWGAYFGFYPWWGGYSSYYGYPRYPYYPMSPMLYYGPYGGEYRSARLGALDLNVKPKKTEVWVDGQLIGPSGKFDGFPGYLWLERGRHQLVFHRPGFATEVKDVVVLQGTVVKVNLRLQEGETVPPESLVSSEYVPRRRPARRSAPVTEDPTIEESVARAPEYETREPEPRRQVTVEPGRLLLSIEPGDASVYLDGRFLGTADELSRLHAGLLVNAGKHTLEVVRPGFHAERMELEIEADTDTAVAVELEDS